MIALQELNADKIRSVLLEDVPVSYRTGARRFVDFLTAKEYGVTAQGLQAYMRALEEAADAGEIASNTFNYYRAAAINRVKQVLEYLEPGMNVAKKYEFERFLRRFRTRKTDQSIDHSKALSRKEIQRFLEECPNQTIALMFEFLASTGLRVSEMLGIKHSRIKDLSCVEYCEIWVLGKGKKERTIKVGKDLMHRVREHFSGNEYLFHSRQLDHRYSRSYVSMSIKRWGRKILGKDISAHTLRHSYATIAHEHGVPLQAIQRQLGHASIQITADMYTEVRMSWDKQKELFS